MAKRKKKVVRRRRTTKMTRDQQKAMFAMMAVQRSASVPKHSVRVIEKRAYTKKGGPNTGKLQGLSIAFMAKGLPDISGNTWRSRMLRDDLGEDRHPVLALRKNELGRIELQPGYAKGEGFTLHVTNSQVRRKFVGKGFGTRLYVTALREAKKRGFGGITSHIDDRNPETSGRVWKTLKGKKRTVVQRANAYIRENTKDKEFQAFLHGQPGTDYVSSVRPHARARGKKKKQLVDNAFKMLVKGK